MAGWTIFALLVMAGCNNKPHADIEGKVTLDGVPVPSRIVGFNSVDGVSAFSIRCRADGTYKGIDVPLGPMKVCIDRSAVSGPPGNRLTVKKSRKRKQKGAADSAAGTTASIPKKYHDPDTSGLTTTINPGANNYDIELSSH